MLTEYKSAKIPKSHYGAGGRGGKGRFVSNFQLLMPSPNLLKSQSRIMVGGGGGGALVSYFQFLMLSTNMLKSQSPIIGGGGSVQIQIPTFDAKSKSAKIPKSHYSKGGWIQLPTFAAESKSAKIPKSHCHTQINGICQT